MLINIEIAYPLYHLDGKRVEYWTNMTTGVETLVRAWRDGDRARYKKYYDNS